MFIRFWKVVRVSGAGRTCTPDTVSSLPQTDNISTLTY